MAERGKGGRTAYFEPFPLMKSVASAKPRHDAVAKLFKSAGGKLLNYYVTMGEYDFLVISEFNNGIDATSALMVAAGTARAISTPYPP